ncbi:MAG: LEA type 2 family protein [Treponema sp.]|jgi:LEA14-like dessication related protein|nr:LEA type 2 family protein [Treponema sp.]
MKKPFRMLLFLFPLFFCLTCKSAPPAEPLPVPSVSLSFDHAGAENLDKAILYYHLTVENPHTVPAAFDLRDWSVMVNGVDLDKKDLVLATGGTPAEGTVITAGAGESAEVIFALALDLWLFHGSGSLPGASDISDDYIAVLKLDLSWRYDTEKPVPCTVQADAVFPRIREPQFTITSIAILQAELVNTRFKVRLRIDNPNAFPVDLSSFGYELYGEGRFWADGTEKNVLHIPAKGAAETNLFLVMNFINMKRSLLDEVIAMNLVRYRFSGELEVETGVSYLPKFHMSFDRSGDSVVLK